MIKDTKPKKYVKRRIKKGKYSPINPAKYKGDPTRIFYRSGWELKVMKVFDLRDDIVEWSSEEMYVWYKVPQGKRPHRYFPDFIVTMREKDGKLVKYMIEVKPDAQTRAPKIQKIKTKRYIKEVLRWAVNKSKFEAAERYCAENDMIFRTITEKLLGTF